MGSSAHHAHAPQARALKHHGGGMGVHAGAAAELGRTGGV
jgi:hypothetical protein